MPLTIRSRRNSQKDCANVDIRPPRELSDNENIRTERRPCISAKVPQIYPPSIMPRKTAEFSQPFDESDKLNSHVAGGRINEMLRISIASLDKAQPQSANRQ